MATTANKGLRSCIVCGKQAKKAELLRIVRAPSGVVAFDKTGRASGRGAYVCSAECFAAACEKNKLDRALKTTLSEDDYKQLATEIASLNSEVEVK